MALLKIFTSGVVVTFSESKPFAGFCIPPENRSINAAVSMSTYGGRPWSLPR